MQEAQNQISKVPGNMIGLLNYIYADISKV